MMAQMHLTYRGVAIRVVDLIQLSRTAMLTDGQLAAFRTRIQVLGVCQTRGGDEARKLLNEPGGRLALDVGGGLILVVDPVATAGDAVRPTDTSVSDVPGGGCVVRFSVDATESVE